LKRKGVELNNTKTTTGLELKVHNNFLKIMPAYFLLPIFFLIIIFLYLFIRDALNVHAYINIQKQQFFSLNAMLSQYPSTQYNLTQFGDPLIFLSLLSILIIRSPKIWECLISALLVCALLSYSLKRIFAVPRPAAAFPDNSFVIIGKTLSGNTSLPSGHSITIFAVLTVLLYAFLPKRKSSKIIWVVFVFTLGGILIFTRVGVGAHYPLDVISGAIIGYLSGILGVFISRENNILGWVKIKKYYPIVFILFLICCIFLTVKIARENLVIFYFAFISLAVTTFKIVHLYVKK
jgi:membrane-associated phospholipid phosphatase